MDEFRMDGLMSTLKRNSQKCNEIDIPGATVAGE